MMKNCADFGEPQKNIAIKQSGKEKSGKEKSSDPKGEQLLGRTRTKLQADFTGHPSWSQEYSPSARATTDARMTPISLLRADDASGD